MTKPKGFKSISDFLPVVTNEDKYISREFQKYGYELARELDDVKHASLYIKLAKDNNRALLENARSFVKDAQNVRSKPKLYMWRLKQLKEQKELRDRMKMDKGSEKDGV